MKRFDIINKLIKDNDYSTYLEIGVANKQTLNTVKIAHKEGVDPVYNTTYKMTSDAFFAKIPKSKAYDIIFIDGLHLEEQTMRDVNNSLKHLNDGGIIVMHDCSPFKKTWQLSHPLKSERYNWNGTVWKAFAKLRMTREDLFMCVVETDYGCGIVYPGSQKLFVPKEKEFELNFEFLEENRKELLNLILVEEFLKTKFPKE